MTKVAVVISGCGSLDGAEIFETVFTLLELDKNNADVKIFAPNKNQHYVIRGKFNELSKSEKYLCKPLKPSASVLKIIYS